MDTERHPTTGSGSSGVPTTGCAVGLLGALQVHPGLTATDLGAPKQRDLFAILALHAGSPVANDRLAEELWDGHPPRTYPHSIQLYVSALRRILAASGSRVDLATDRRGYRLVVNPDDVDLHRFRRLVAQGLAEAAQRRWPEAVETLGAALALWRGTPLRDFSARAFADAPITTLNTMRLDALESLGAAYLELGDADAATRLAQEVLVADGLRERARSTLMLALYRSGRTAEALRTFEELRRLLEEELGADPSPQLRQLHQRILQHDEGLRVVGPATTSPAPAATVAPPLPDAPDTGARPRPRSWGRPAIVVAGVVTIALAGTLLGYTLSEDPPAAPARALLVHHGDGEVNLMVEDGFDRGVTELGLLAKEVETGDANAALTIEEQLTPGTLVLDFTIETDTAALARTHRDSTFVALDEPAGTDHAGLEPNLTMIRFSTHEASFLAGYAAALTSRTRTVGFVGGVDYGTIWPFEAGYTAGARAADPDVEVLVRYLSRPPRYGAGFVNPRAGERAARSLYASGADVVFAAAGTSGLGVFEAAASESTDKRQLWAIGVDSDQYRTVATLPGTVDVEGWRRHILTSVVLRFDRAVYASMVAHVRGTLQPGLERYDLANGGVELSYSGGHLSRVRDELEGVRRDVLDGEITVPCTPGRVRDDEVTDC